MGRLAAPPLLLLLLGAACSGKARPDGVGSSGTGGSAGGTAGTGGTGGSGGSGGSGAPVAPPSSGDVQIRVEWADVPMAARASPGRTPCHTPRAPSVAPTVTWGVPEAVVIVEGAPSIPAGASSPAGAPDAPAGAAEAWIVLADCALSPRVAIGSSLVVESAADRPTSVALAKRAELPKPEAAAAADGAAAAAAAARVVRLPIAGHAVGVPLDAGGVYELATADKDPELAWIVAPRPGAAAAVTDAAGQIVLRGVPAGPHAVLAWLPPRAGQPARIARGTVTVVAGQLAELTLPLEPVP